MAEILVVIEIRHQAASRDIPTTNYCVALTVVVVVVAVVVVVVRWKFTVCSSTLETMTNRGNTSKN